MPFKPKRKLRVLLLMDQSLVPPASLEGLTPEQILPFKNELHVLEALNALGHEVRQVGVDQDLRVLRRAAEEFRPHVVFNLLVEMHGYSMFEPHVVSYLELIRFPYTGCNPRGLMVAHDKALTKKILSYHRIPVPAFGVFPFRRKVVRNPRLRLPLFVKSLVEEGSEGISKASLVNSDEALAERVDFIHRKTQAAAIAEQYIEGREIYVAVLGNNRLQSFTPWELVMEKLPEGQPNIATSKVKWDRKYQKKVGLVTRAADLTEEQKSRVTDLSKRIYRILNLSGYARMDFRMTESGTLYLLEANPNPDISNDEDFADSAGDVKLSYEALIQKILTTGMSYQPRF